MGFYVLEHGFGLGGITLLLQAKIHALQKKPIFCVADFIPVKEVSLLVVAAFIGTFCSQCGYRFPNNFVVAFAF